MVVLSKQRKTLYFFVAYVFSFLIFFGLAEAGLRLLGYRPYSVPQVELKVEPGGRLFQQDETLGYVNLPGRYTVTYPTGHQSHLNIQDDFNRITAPPAIRARNAGKHRPQIWIFGCSFTFGLSLQNEETFPYILQQRFPQYEIVNFGTSGYGTVHSLLQLQRALEERPRGPALVLYVYGGFHDSRNTALRFRQKAVVPWQFLGGQKTVHARIAANGTLAIEEAPLRYQEFPFMRYSALVHFLEIQYNALEFRLSNGRLLSKLLIKEFERKTRAAGANFLVVTITPDPDMLRYFKSESLFFGNISVDLNQPGMSNAPHDDHPGALANRLYAGRLEQLIRELFRLLS